MMRARQRGVALIMAVVLVALATVLAVSIGFSSAMTARRSVATYSVEQGLLFAEGAEALAAYVLQKDPNKNEDTTAEFWNQPYGPVEIAPEIALKAQLSDEQGKFNLNTLLGADGKADVDAVAVFTRILVLLELEPRWAPLLADWLDDDDNQESQGGEDGLYAAQRPSGRTGNLTLTSISELLQLPGFGRERYEKLKSHVTALPPEVRKINVCTADPIVLDALYELAENPSATKEYSDVDPVQFAKNRATACYPTEKTLTDVVGGAKIGTRISSTTSYFSLHTVVSIGTTRFTLYSLMLRDGNGARPILRTFGTE